MPMSIGLSQSLILFIVVVYYWLFRKNEEIIISCNRGGVPHKHCMDIVIAEKMI